MSWDVSPFRPSAPSLLPIALGVGPSLLRIRLGTRILPRSVSGELGRTEEMGLWGGSGVRQSRQESCSHFSLRKAAKRELMPCDFPGCGRIFSNRQYLNVRDTGGVGVEAEGKIPWAEV